MNTTAKKIWITTSLIIAVGLVGLYSASFENVRVPQKVFYDQLGCAIFGLVLMFLTSRVDIKRFYDMAYPFYILNIILLLWVSISGRHALGATRWIEIGGVSFQPSELSKLAIILVLARYLANRRPVLSFGLYNTMQKIVTGLLIPMALTGVLMLLIFMQPDLGTSLLLLGICLALVFVSELEYRYFFGFLGLGAAILPFLWQILKPYQKDRLLVFLNPNIDPLGAGYTIIQSKIAIGSGQIFGKGWLSGTQNQLNFLPERHTDFIFSVIGEEWGLVGGMILVVLFFMLVQYCLDITKQCREPFATYTIVGIVTILVLQVVINIGMVMGLFPIVGLTLPFVSYGRTSFVVFLFMMGIILSLSRKRMIF